MSWDSGSFGGGGEGGDGGSGGFSSADTPIFQGNSSSSFFPGANGGGGGEGGSFWGPSSGVFSNASGDPRQSGGSFGDSFVRREEQDGDGDGYSGGGSSSSSGWFGPSAWLPAAAAGLAGYGIGRATAGGGGRWGHQSNYPPPAPPPYPPPHCDGHCHGDTPGMPRPPYGPSGPYPTGPYPSGPYPTAAGRPPPPLVAVRRREPRGQWLRRAGVVAALGAFFVLYFFVFSSEHVQMYLHEQRLLTANTIFVTSIVVSPSSSSSAAADVAPSLFRFSEAPPLAGVERWTDSHSAVSVRRYGYESWSYWFNEGSSVDVSFQTGGDTRLLLGVIRGSDSMDNWKNDPNAFTDYELKTVISGSGSVRFKADKAGQYFFAVGNFQRYQAQLAIQFHIASTVFDLSSATSHCQPATRHPCDLKLEVGSDAAAVLVAPPGPSVMSQSTWKMSISYTTRWSSYFLLMGAIIFISYAVARRMDRHDSLHRSSRQLINPTTVTPSYSAMPNTAAPLLSTSTQMERAPLIPSDWVASTASQQQTKADHAVATAPRGDDMEASAPPLDDLAGGVTGGRGGEEEGDLCVICMSAKKDCVILDCGHRATCLPCGQLLANAPKRECPICRKHIRQVVKVYDT